MKKGQSVKESKWEKKKPEDMNKKFSHNLVDASKSFKEGLSALFNKDFVNAIGPNKKAVNIYEWIKDQIEYNKLPENHEIKEHMNRILQPAYLNLGISYKYADPNKSLDYLMKAHDLNPKDQGAIRGLMDYYTKNQMPQSLIDIAEKLDDPIKDEVILRAKTQLGQIQPEEALKTSKPASQKLSPQDLRLNLKIKIEAYIVLGNLKGACTASTTFIKTNEKESSEIQYDGVLTALKSYCSKGFFEVGLSFLEKLYEQNPDLNNHNLLNIKYYEFILYEMNDKYAAADQILKKILTLKDQANFKPITDSALEFIRLRQNMLEFKSEASPSYSSNGGIDQDIAEEIIEFSNSANKVENDKKSYELELLENESQKLDEQIVDTNTKTDLDHNNNFVDHAIAKNQELSSKDFQDLASSGATDEEEASHNVKTSQLDLTIQETMLEQKNQNPAFDSGISQSQETTCHSDYSYDGYEVLTEEGLRPWQRFEHAKNKRIKLATKSVDSTSENSHVASWKIEGVTYHANQDHIVKIDGRDNYYISVKNDAHLSEDMLRHC